MNIPEDLNDFSSNFKKFVSKIKLYNQQYFPEKDFEKKNRCEMYK
jgi:hypothetical protein